MTKRWITRNVTPESKVVREAFRLASFHHYGQKRKGGLPYLTHLVAVAKLIKAAGYSEKMVAAGLLHDVLEDTGCELEDITKAVGGSVARMVVEITDKDKTMPWKKRKANYLKTLQVASRRALVVACADKADNIQSLMQGYQNKGVSFINSFSGKIKAKIRNYENIYKVIAKRHPSCRLLGVYRKRLEKVKCLFIP